MLAEFANFLLMVAMMLSLLFGVMPIVSAQQGSKWILFVRPAVNLYSLFIFIAFVCLIFSFINDDFALRYVASNSNSQLPLIYKISATWGGHEGSLLLWVLMLSMWTVAVNCFSAQLPRVFLARILSVLSLLHCGFLSFIIFTSNPFARLLSPASEGKDLNPMLQDPGLVLHPPMLYMGYVGFSVVFAFAIASLIAGRLDAAWAKWSRPWAIAAWCALTLGIALGSAWAYYELGWGGWWFWDPVENASFMPWLVGTALIHSLVVVEKRGSFKNWTVLLAIAAFSLSLLGTFLVRSGVLTSVHAFATDPSRGIFILIFLVIVVGSSLVLFAWRASSVGLGGRFSLLSRESSLLVNNLLLLVATITVCLGTLYPLLIDALNLGKISVGPPYFNLVFAPLMLPLLFFLSIGPQLRWKSDKLANLRMKLFLPSGLALISLIAAYFVLPLILHTEQKLSILGLIWIYAALFLTFSIAVDYVKRVSKTNNSHTISGFISNIFRQPLAFTAMHVAHLGIAVFVFGVTLVNTFEQEHDIAIKVGETIKINQHYQVTFTAVKSEQRENYQAFVATVELNEANKIISLSPEKRKYFSSSMPMTEAAINISLLRDIYISLGEPIDDSRWAMRVYIKPFIDWIWLGCVLMALGGFLALLAKLRK